MAGIPLQLAPLYRARAHHVAFLDVPELTYASVQGTGAPEGADFADAVQALFAVSYGAHFLLRKRAGAAPGLLPLEAQWWVEAPDQLELVGRVAAGKASPAQLRRVDWHWQAMIALPPPITPRLAAQAAAQARQRELPGLRRLRWVTWTEGWCGQVLHVGPYEEVWPAIEELHGAIAAAGHRPRGRHHEIYLGDPRRIAPDRLRTILRQPVEPAPADGFDRDPPGGQSGSGTGPALRAGT